MLGSAYNLCAVELFCRKKGLVSSTKKAYDYARTNITKNADIINSDKLLQSKVKTLIVSRKRDTYVDGYTLATKATRTTNTMNIVLTVSRGPCQHIVVHTRVSHVRREVVIDD
jgi:hypothetical protein